MQTWSWSHYAGVLRFRGPLVELAGRDDCATVETDDVDVHKRVYKGIVTLCL